MAWTVRWGGKDFFVEDNLQIEYARDGVRVFWSLPDFLVVPPAKFLIGYSPGGRGVIVGGGTCREIPWTRCIKVPRSFEELLRNPQAPPEPVAISEICHMELKRSDIPPWQPSPDSAQKRELLEKMQAEIRRILIYYPLFEKVIVNDFNLLDPLVWAVGDVKDPSGKQERQLVFLEINSGTGYVHAARNEEPGPERKDLIEKVLANGIELW
ncbi:MAG: hypothetical protein HY313_10480 [Acidobacteria bacterium]|nr:hypothetical protein [Acidobacteriota bacterium]